MPILERGALYTREEIHAALGGGVQDYLPHRAGRVVCACLNPELNPSAPEIVLPGFGPQIERWAHTFAEQSHFIPAFLKRDTGAWEYVGDYRVRRVSVIPADIAPHAEDADRDDVSMVLFLEPATA